MKVAHGTLEKLEPQTDGNNKSHGKSDRNSQQEIKEMEEPTHGKKGIEQRKLDKKEPKHIETGEKAVFILFSN